jgi:hypothetical protein
LIIWLAILSIPKYRHSEEKAGQFGLWYVKLTPPDLPKEPPVLTPSGAAFEVITVPVGIETGTCALRLVKAKKEIIRTKPDCKFFFIAIFFRKASIYFCIIIF